ncbi:endonuclease/exonuclease/phosphatase family protein [Dactylosporangium salmoneum]|uniref:Endonuclease/exonuclease/phosphatase domain-containing protein n=1 Tax=Dactylosporangium salmoneum TaxID=53361 RepID=A0ABP5SYW5_9ACTN
MPTLVTINALDLYGDDTDEQQRRYEGVEALLRELDADIIAVQELRVPRPAPTPRRVQRAAAAARLLRHAEAAQQVGAQVRLRRLAEAVGRRCDTGDRTDNLLLGVGGGVHHVGLLWNDDTVAALPGRVQRFGRDAGMWHSMVTAVFDLGNGVLARVGSVHLPPFDQTWAIRDTSQILRAIHADTLPGFLGGDFNNLSAVKVADPAAPGAEAYFDPDPYAGLAWHPQHVYQLDADGVADRRAAHRLEAEHLGRMHDCAVLTGQPWTPDDRAPPQRRASTPAAGPLVRHPPRPGRGGPPALGRPRRAGWRPD